MNNCFMKGEMFDYDCKKSSKQLERHRVDLGGAIDDEVELRKVLTTYNNQEFSIKKFQYKRALAQSNEYRLNLDS